MSANDPHRCTDTLTATVADATGSDELIVVSNRELYSHEYDGDEVTVTAPAGGLTAALDLVMATLDGAWIARVFEPVASEADDAPQGADGVHARRD